MLEVLRFSEVKRELLTSLGEDEWKKLLAFCDAAQLTLTLHHLARSSLPTWVRTRADRNYRDNAVRFARLEGDIAEVMDRFSEENIDFVLLKGAAHAPDFTPDPLLRAIGDIDLWCLPHVVMSARDELLRLGYRPIAQSKGRHLAPMIRETEWRWRGDYYAADLPIPVDLHYCIWDEKLEHIRGPREDVFWNRRSSAAIHGRTMPILAGPDALAFAALHLLMHILHGDLRLQRAWEIGHFLNNRASDEAFWVQWRQLHSPELRKLEVIVFVLVEKWFGSKLPTVVEGEAQELPEDIKLWINKYALSPIEGLFAPNKDELWLNLCLVESFRDKVSVFLRRVFPRPRFIPSRATHHVRTLPATIAEGLKWWTLRQSRAIQRR